MPSQEQTLSKIGNPATLIALGAGPLFVYPCLYVVMLTADSVFGDRLILDHMIFVSRRDIWDLFWADWAAALLPSFVLALPVLIAALAIHHRTGRSFWILLPGLALTAGLIVSIAVFAGAHMMEIFAATILFSFPATWILSKCAA